MFHFAAIEGLNGLTFFVLGVDLETTSLYHLLLLL